jgi:hypothetical protein
MSLRVSRRRAVVIADADARERRKIARELEAEFDVIEAGSCREAEELLRSKVDVVALVADRRIPFTPDGERLLAFLARARPELARVSVHCGRAWRRGAVLEAVRACMSFGASV